MEYVVSETRIIKDPNWYRVYYTRQIYRAKNRRELVRIKREYSGLTHTDRVDDPKARKVYIALNELHNLREFLMTIDMEDDEKLIKSMATELLKAMKPCSMSCKKSGYDTSKAEDFMRAAKKKIEEENNREALRLGMKARQQLFMIKRNRQLQRSNDSKYYYNQAMEKARESSYEESLELFEKATKMNVNNTEAWYNFGVTLFNLKKYDDAAGIWEWMLERDPEDPYARKCLEEFIEAWFNLGIAYYSVGKYKDSAKTFGILLKKVPDHEIAKKCLEEVKAKIVKPPEAEKKDPNEAKKKTFIAKEWLRRMKKARHGFKGGNDPVDKGGFDTIRDQMKKKRKEFLRNK